ncbi:hypothetical protein [Paenibacillus sp. SAFN-117]|uniref:ATP-binding protein n=1 Tax=Paenibacillus sp. SAFN-117 TaxID=3436860 RepID=UPI003F7EE5F0
MNLTVSYNHDLLPLPPENEIFRESLVRQIRDMFNQDRTKILLEGPGASGKTILLSQFVRLHPERCISFFIKDNFWSTNSSFFLFELCLQMQQIPAISSKFSSAIPQDSLHEDHLIKQLFYRMSRELIAYIKRTGDGPFYFVIDGLDKVNYINGEENILSHLPMDDPAGIFILLSSTGKLEEYIKADSVPIQNFSLEETEKYFREILNHDQIKKIYDISQGMPGYLADTLKSLKKAESSQFDTLISNLPSTYNKLIESAWNDLDKKNIELMNILSVIVSTPEPITVQKLSEILELKKETVDAYISDLLFVELRKSSQIVEINNVYKSFISNKLDELNVSTTQLLISYYESKQVEDSALFLPSLYIKNNNYESLVKLINVENITKILGTQRNVSLVRRIIRSLSEMAYSRGDSQRLFWGALTESFFTQLISNPPVVENQIIALLALDNYENAIQLAYSCMLPEDRLMLFAKIGSEMIKKDQPIPNEILKTLDESVELIDNTVELTEALTDKLLDICTDLITFQTKSALKLIEKIAESRGNSNYKNQLTDILLTNVLIKAGPDDSTAEKIKSQISNDSLNDFAKAASSVLERVTIDDLYEQVEQISDISAKIYLLQSWCNMNDGNHKICEVIMKALDLIKFSEDYAPTQMHLRKLAQCLLKGLYLHDEVELKNLIDEFDKIKETIIKHPIDEYARLDLILARVIKRWSLEEATERYYNVYFGIDKIQDIDIRCFVIVRLLLAHKELAPNDSKLENEFVTELSNFFDTLLNTSADHLEITKKLIAALTKYNHELAVSFSAKLNRARRRDFAYGEVLREYTSQASNCHSVNFINQTLDLIENRSYRDWVYVQIIKRFTKSSLNTPYQEKLKYLDRILSIQHSTGRTYAITYFVSWIYNDNPDKAKQLFNNLIQSYEKIDCLWEQVSCGFDVSSVLAIANRELSLQIYKLAETKKSSSVFTDERITTLYLEICKIIIRIVPDILNSKDFKERISYCVRAISLIPSSIERNILLSSLALKCLLHNKKDLFNELSTKVLFEIEHCQDELTLQQLLIDSAPLLFEVERNVLFNKLEILPEYLRDGALDEVLKYLFTKRIPIDPVDISNYPTNISFAEALKVIELINHLRMDAVIYCYIYKLVESVTYKQENKLKTSLNERQVLTIAEKLSKIVNEKLPDTKNITHDGYKIACRISINKLKEALRGSSSFRANTRWDPLNLSWEEIKREILTVPNCADKVLLQATAATESYATDKSFSETIIAVAEKDLKNITNSVDRAGRFHIVAKSYNELSNSKAAKFLLEEVVKQSNAFSSQESRDQLLGSAVELAHSIDPIFASSLAENIDSPMFVSKSREKILALNLRSDPSRLDISKKDDYLPVISSACGTILNTLYSGRGVVQHEAVISKWMYYCLGYDFETTYNIALWYIENSVISRSKSFSTPRLESLYSETLQLLDMISKMGQVINNLTATSETSTFLENVAPKMHTFSLGERDAAIDFLRCWLSDYATEYVKIYDAYFGPTDLELLKYIPQNVDVKILCSSKQKDLDITSIHEKYKLEWKNICDQNPPETMVYIYSTPSGRTPQHDRFIVTDKAGLVLGTSLNGLGSRDTIINMIDHDEKVKIEKQIIDELITNPPRFVDDERLISRIFSFEV